MRIGALCGLLGTRTFSLYVAARPQILQAIAGARHRENVGLPLLGRQSCSRNPGFADHAPVLNHLERHQLSEPVHLPRLKRGVFRSVTTRHHRLSSTGSHQRSSRPPRLWDHGVPGTRLVRIAGNDAAEGAHCCVRLFCDVDMDGCLAYIRTWVRWGLAALSEADLTQSRGLRISLSTTLG